MKAGWVERPLGEVCDILDRLRKPITKSDRQAGPYPYYGATGVLDHVSGYLFDEPLVLIGEDGAKWEAGANSAFPVSGKVWVNNHAHVIRPHRNKVSDDWLIYFLNASDLMPFVSGMTVPKLNQGRLREIPIPIPPLEEQQRIVAVLDEAFDGLTRARAHAEANLQNARELFDAALTAMFTDPPPEWTPATLASKCSRITVGHVGPMATRYTDTGVIFLRSQNVRPFRIDLTDVKYIDEEFVAELKKSELRPGDVAIVRTGYPGVCAVIPDDIPLANCADLVIARTGPDLSPHFLAMLLNSSFGKQHVAHVSVGAAQQHFNVSSAKAAIFPMPPISEQERLVEKSDEIRAQTTNLEKGFNFKVADIDTLRQSLLQKAFVGELT